MVAEESKSSENDQPEKLIFEGKEITEEELKAFLEMTVNAQNRDTLAAFKKPNIFVNCK